MPSEVAENDRAVIGDNQPFLALCKDLNAKLPEYLALEHAGMVARAKDLKAYFDTAPTEVFDDDGEKLATELGGQLSKFIKLAESQRTIDKAPTLQAGRIVDNFFAELIGLINPCLKSTATRVNAYKDAKALAARRLREEEERKAREAAAEAARLKAEAERAAREESDTMRRAAEIEAAKAADAAKVAQKAASKVTVSTQARGSDGAQSVQSKRWTGEITEIEDLDLESLRPYISVGELEKAVRQYAQKYKDTRELRGARIFETSSTSFKG